MCNSNLLCFTDMRNSNLLCFSMQGVLTGLQATNDGRSSAEHSKQSRIIDTESEAMLSVSNLEILLRR